MCLQLSEVPQLITVVVLPLDENASLRPRAKEHILIVGRHRIILLQKDKASI